MDWKPWRNRLDFFGLDPTTAVWNAEIIPGDHENFDTEWERRDFFKTPGHEHGLIHHTSMCYGREHHTAMKLSSRVWPGPCEQAVALSPRVIWGDEQQGAFVNGQGTL